MYYDIGSLDGCVAAQSAHCDTYMAEGKDGSIVDAVAYKGYPVGSVLFQFLYVLYFTVGQQVAIRLRHP